MITIPRDRIISHSLRQGPSQSFVICSSCEKDKHTAHWGGWAREGRQRLNLWQETGQWPEDLFHTPRPIVWYSRLGSEGCVVWSQKVHFRWKEPQQCPVDTRALVECSPFRCLSPDCRLAESGQRPTQSAPRQTTFSLSHTNMHPQ